MGDLLSGLLRCFPSFLSFFPTFSLLGWDLISTRHYVDVVAQITLALVVLSFGAVLEPFWFNDRQTSLVLHPWFGPIAAHVPSALCLVIGDGHLACSFVE